MVSRTGDSDTRKGWQLTAIVAILTIGIQAAGWVWWFGGWKSVTDLRIAALETVVKDLPAAINQLGSAQQVISSKLSNLLEQEHANRRRNPNTE